MLFTDIIGSSERAAAMGDKRWRVLLERHDEIVHAEVNHPLLIGTAKVIAVVRERSENRGACFLTPRLLRSMHIAGTLSGIDA